MKLTAICVLLTLLLTAGAVPTLQSAPAADPSAALINKGILQWDHAQTEGEMLLIESYYAAQTEEVRAYILKPRFLKQFTEHYTPAALEGIQHQAWQVDTFARYDIVDAEGNSLSERPLYYCTFLADHDRYGYIVVAYVEEGPAIQNEGVVESKLLYDLRANYDAVLALLGETDLDLSSTEAKRVRVVDAALDSMYEAILFTDQSGQRYLCSLETLI